MNKRWRVALDGVNFNDTMEPLNGGDLALQYKRDLSKGQIFYRETLSGVMRFGGADFRKFWAIEQQASRRCDTILIVLEYQCASIWKEKWRGQFSTGAGGFDLDQCLTEIPADVLDDVTCLIEASKNKSNILNTPPKSVNVTALPSGMEIIYQNNLPLPAPQLEQFGWEQVDTQALIAPAMGACPETSYNLGIWWRETVRTQCLNDAAVEPSGTGWIQLEACGEVVENSVLWARPPLVPWPFPDNPLYVGPPDGPGGDPPQPPVTPDCPNWLRVDSFTCPGGFQAGIFICLNDATTTTNIDTGRLLYDALARIIEDSGCPIAGIRSDFFEWNPVGDAPDYQPGYNYVTLEPNQVDQLIIVQKSDAIDPDATNPATIGNVTFEEFMKWMRDIFRVYWIIDEDGYLRLEHWKYWASIASAMDISTPSEPLKYTHNKGTIPRRESASWMEALGEDFVGLDIVYDPTCAKDESEEINPGKITTDISLILSTPAQISKDGFVILATTFDGSEYNTILDLGVLTGSPITNAPMSWANLQDAFWRWDRYLPNGNMNGVETGFDDHLPNVTQEEYMISMCCEALTFEPEFRLVTNLGNRLGATGVIDSASLSLKDDMMTLNLQYGYRTRQESPDTSAVASPSIHALHTLPVNDTADRLTISPSSTR